MDSRKRFEETKLPPKEAFFSKLSDENINKVGYAHAHPFGRPWVQDRGGQQRSLLPYRRLAFGTCLRDVPKDMPSPIRPGPRTLQHKPVAFLGRPSQEDRF